MNPGINKLSDWSVWEHFESLKNQVKLPGEAEEVLTILNSLISPIFKSQIPLERESTENKTKVAEKYAIDIKCFNLLSPHI